MHIVRGETGALANGRGLDVAVDALLAQDGERRACAARHVGGGDVLLGIEAERDRQAGVRFRALRAELLVRTLRLIAQAPQAPRGL